MTNEDIVKLLRRIDEKLSTLIAEKKKKTWVKVTTITSLTDWDKYAMHRARQSGLVEVRKSKDKGIEYCVESIPDIFIVNKPSV
jgi:hypothetical protein